MDKKEVKQRIEKLRETINKHRYLYHVLDKQEISDSALDSLKKELFDRLLNFAKNGPDFALKELNSKETGLNAEEVKNRLKIFGYNNLIEDKKTNHLLKLLKK
jgi:DNA ligase (NAD+)